MGGIIEIFLGGCPYVWLSAFTWMFLPIILLIKWVGKIIFYFIDLKQVSKDEWFNKQELLLLNNPELIKEWVKNIENNSNYYRFFYYRASYELYDKILHEYEKYKAQTENKSQANKQKINKLVKTVQPITQFLLVAITITVLFLLGMGIAWFVSQSQYFNWTLLKDVLLLLVTIILAAVVIYYVFQKFFESKAAIKLANGITFPFRIVAMMIKNACPKVIWE